MPKKNTYYFGAITNSLIETAIIVIVTLGLYFTFIRPIGEIVETAYGEHSHIKVAYPYDNMHVNWKVVTMCYTDSVQYIPVSDKHIETRLSKHHFTNEQPRLP